MRETLAAQALKHISLKIGLIWVEQSGLGIRFSKTPDEATAERATELIKTYIRARKVYDAGNYLGAIEIATEDEA